MGKTIMGAVVSLDGYIANVNGEVGPLFDRLGNGEVELKFTEKLEHPARTTKASADFMRETQNAPPAVTHLLYDVEGRRR